MHDNLPAPVVMNMAEAYTQMFDAARGMLDDGASPRTAHRFRPGQRVFHRSRLGPFRRTTIDELRARFPMNG